MSKTYDVEITITGYITVHATGYDEAENNVDVTMEQIKDSCEGYGMKGFKYSVDDCLLAEPPDRDR